MSIVRTVPVKFKSALLLAKESKRFLARTISLTKFINLSNSSTLTFTGAVISDDFGSPSKSLSLACAKFFPDSTEVVSLDSEPVRFSSAPDSVAGSGWAVVCDEPSCSLKPPESTKETS